MVREQIQNYIEKNAPTTTRFFENGKRLNKAGECWRTIVAIVFFLLVLAAPMRAQDIKHAPLATQCRADVALWNNSQEIDAYYAAVTAHVRYGTPNRTDTNRLSLKEVYARVQEMTDCVSVDPPHFNEYVSVQGFYITVTSDRYFSFIQRHNLIKQLRAEDAAGA
jgi:hypothetical protein